jgi:hypothetical protein
MSCNSSSWEPLTFFQSGNTRVPSIHRESLGFRWDPLEFDVVKERAICTRWHCSVAPRSFPSSFLWVRSCLYMNLDCSKAHDCFKSGIWSRDHPPAAIGHKVVRRKRAYLFHGKHKYGCRKVQSSWTANTLDQIATLLLDSNRRALMQMIIHWSSITRQ